MCSDNRVSLMPLLPRSRRANQAWFRTEIPKRRPGSTQKNTSQATILTPPQEIVNNALRS